jgi:hypothetical protein
LDKLIQHRNIINYVNPLNTELNPICYFLALLAHHFLHVSRIRVKAHRLSWYGHIYRKPEIGIVKKIYKWQPYITRPVGRPKHRWDDDVRNDLRKMKLLK